MSLPGYSSVTEKGNFKFDVQEHLCDFSSYNSKSDNQEIFKEMNIVAWSGRAPQIDIRGWFIKPGESIKRPGKGVSLNKKETDILVNALVSRGYGMVTTPDLPEPPADVESKKTDDVKKSKSSSSSFKVETTTIETPAFTEISEDDLPF